MTGQLGQVALDVTEGDPLPCLVGALERVGGGIEALCSGVVCQHVGTIAYRGGAADPSGGDVDTEQGGVAVTGHERRASGWIEGQAADAVAA